MIDVKEINKEVGEILEPIFRLGFGRKTSPSGATKAIREILEPLFQKQIEIYSDEKAEDIRIVVRLFDSTDGADRVGGAMIYCKEDGWNKMRLDIDRTWLQKSIEGDKRIRTRLMRSLIRAYVHEFLHLIQYHRADEQPGERLMVAGDPFEDGLSYYSDVAEITAWASDAAYEFYRSFDGNMEQIVKALKSPSAYVGLSQRSGSFFRYHKYVYKDTNPLARKVWQRYIKRLYFYLNELSGSGSTWSKRLE